MSNILLLVFAKLSHSRRLSIDTVVVDLVAEVDKSNVGSVYPLERVDADVVLGDEFVDYGELVLPQDGVRRGHRAVLLVAFLNKVFSVEVS